MKAELQELFDQLSSRVSLTIDLWTSQDSEDQNLDYCCVTCHYIDNDWKLHKKIIAYQLVPPPLTRNALSGIIKSEVLSWNIDNKLFALAVDNAFHNEVVVRDLKEWLICKGVLTLNGDLFHMRCITQLLNRIAQDGLEVVGDLLKKIRDSIDFSQSSQNTQQMFKEALTQTNLAGKEVFCDVPTQWNSTYIMLENAIEVRLAFERLAELAPDYEYLPTSQEWEVGKVICDCLRVLYMVKLNFSRAKYPTTNMYFKGVYEVHRNILRCMSSEYDYVRAMACKMKDKFDEYWSTCNLSMIIGMVLDPRYKMAFIEFAFNMIYGGDSQTYINKVFDSLNELYSSYERHPISSMDQFGNSSSLSLDLPGAESCNHGGSPMSEDFKNFMEQNHPNSQKVKKTELEKYLEENLLPLSESFDILVWWKDNSRWYPTLARIARDILAIPVSTVASESSSSGDGVITKSRFSLGTDLVEALSCIKDWLP